MRATRLTPNAFVLVSVLLCILVNRGSAQVTETNSGITPKEQLGLTFQGGGRQAQSVTGVSQGPQSVSLSRAEMHVLHQADVRHARTPVVEVGSGWDAVRLYGPNAKPSR